MNGKDSPAMSLEDLLKPHLVNDDCLKNINFDLESFNKEQLANYLVASNSSRCAVCFLKDPHGSESQATIGHAVNMYNYVNVKDKEYFCYKDSLAEVYLQYKQFPDQGLKLHRKDFNKIIDAWTFTAKYNRKKQ